MIKKYYKFYFILALLIFLFPFKLLASDEIIFFWGQGCAHCAKVESYIQKENLHKVFNIEEKEVNFNQKNREEFMKICDDYNISLSNRGVPLALIDGKCIEGDSNIIQTLKQKLEENQNCDNQDTCSPQPLPSKNDSKLTLPLILGAAGVDAINPCAFAVLIILMTTILASGKKKRALWSGLSFALAVYISYLLMGLGIYRALATANLSIWFMKIIAGLAILIGLLNIKEYFWYGKFFIMEVPRKWRPAMKKIIHSVTSPLGSFSIGFLISLFLLPCTSGPYIVILGMLSQRASFVSALSWLLLYNFIFILPMIIITLAVYKGLDPQKLEKERSKRLRILHLIAGFLMISIGIAMFFNFV